jgi:hypothetical protein
LTLLVGDVELLVGDQELGAGGLTRPDLGVGIVTLAGELEPVLVGEIPDSLERRAAVNRDVVFREERDDLLAVVQIATKTLQGGLVVGTSMQPAKRDVNPVTFYMFGTHSRSSRAR